MFGVTSGVEQGHCCSYDLNMATVHQPANQPEVFPLLYTIPQHSHPFYTVWLSQKSKSPLLSNLTEGRSLISSCLLVYLRLIQLQTFCSVEWEESVTHKGRGLFQARQWPAEIGENHCKRSYAALGYFKLYNKSKCGILLNELLFTSTVNRLT